MMRPQSMGDLVPRDGAYRVHMRFARSLFLLPAKKSGDGFFIVPPGIGEGPLNLVVENPNDFLPTDTFHPATLPNEIPIYDSHAPHMSADELRRLHHSLAKHLPRLAPPDSLAHVHGTSTPLAERFAQGRAALAAHRYAAAAKLLTGLGPGLTPAGDDYLSGVLLALHLQNNPRAAARLHRAIQTTNPVSSAFLNLAKCGRVNAPLRALLTAPDGRGITARIAAVCAFGHTSGADLLTALHDSLAP